MKVIKVIVDSIPKLGCFDCKFIYNGFCLAKPTTPRIRVINHYDNKTRPDWCPLESKD